MTRLSREVHGPIIAEMTTRGMTDREIAQAIGGTTHKAVAMMRFRLGIQSPRSVDLEAVERMTRAGLSAREIASNLGTTSRSVVRARGKLGLSQTPRDIYPLDVRERALEMLDEGMPKTEIARTLGVSDSAVIRWAKGKPGISPQEIAIFSSALRTLREMEAAT